MKLAAALAAILCLAPAVARAADQTAPGRLDLSFSDDGLLRAGLGAQEVRPQDLAVLSRGRPLVLTNGPLARFTRAGRLDAGFGRRGAAGVSAGEGDGNNALFTTAPAPGGAATYVAGRQRFDRLAVMRVTADGEQDPAFGERGVAVSDTGGFIYGARPFALPDGGVVTVAIYQGPGIFGTPFPQGSPRLLAEERDAQGRLVAEFADRGRATIALPHSPDYEAAVLVRRLGDGRLVIAVGVNGGHVELVRLLADGRPDPALGPSGLRELAATFPNRVGGVAMDTDRRLLVAGTLRGGVAAVLRVSLDGQTDPTFGTGGLARIAAGPGRWLAGAVAVGGHERIAVALTHRATPGARGRAAAALLHSDGSPVRSFGRRGVASAGAFGARGPATGDLVAFDGPRLLVLAGGVGDGLSSIRDDFGRDVVGLARLRVERAVVAVAFRATVSARGVLHVRLSCRLRFATCRTRLAVSGHGLHASDTVPVKGRRVVAVHLGPRAAALAARHARLRVSVAASEFGPLDHATFIVGLRRTT